MNTKLKQTKKYSLVTLFSCWRKRLGLLEEWASLVVLAVKNCLQMQETQELWVWSLGGEDPLEEEMTICSSILAWRIPRTEEPGRLQSIGSQRGRRYCSYLACMHAHRENQSIQVWGCWQLNGYRCTFRDTVDSVLNLCNKVNIAVRLSYMNPPVSQCI